MSEVSVPRDAATVILTRDGAQGKMEVFLMRRHRDQAFMGGAYVFPGGSIDESDADPELAGFMVGPAASETVKHLQEPDVNPSIALGLYVTAIRETFEEAGVLLAYDKSGQALQFGTPELNARYTDIRQDIYRKKYSLKALVHQENIRLALDLLMPFAHWITPTFEKKRFNTRFFIARVPNGQIPLHDSIEMTESLWMSPSEALSAYREKKILLMPPTLKNLEELTRFGSTEDLFQGAMQKSIYPIMPQAYKVDELPALLLPHDPEYLLEDYKQPVCSDDPSRIVFRDKMWQTEFPNLQTNS